MDQEMDQEKAIEKFRLFVASEGDTLLRLLAHAEQIVAHQLLTQLKNLGYDNISLAELRIMQQLCLSGMRMTELVSQTKLSKQAISQLIFSLENKGFLTTRSDPDDRRVKTITYTKQGYQFIADAIDANFMVEDEVSDLLKQENLCSLKRILLTLNRSHCQT
jgi:DNA-binding MarR family transcriptional regulator